MFDESFLSLFKDGDSIIDRKFDENEFFLFNENKKCNSIKNDSSINSYEDKENSIYEIFECTNILTKLRTIFIRIDIIKKRGRKSNNQKAVGIIGKHDKNSKDNKLRKVKVIIFETIFRTINLLLGIINVNNVNKELKRLNNEQTKELRVEYNKELLNTKNKDIFSSDISSKYRDEPDYNKKIIKSIYEEKEKYEKVVEILEKALEECFQDFRDEENESELKKMLKKVFDEKLKKETDEYKNDIWEMIINYEKIFREIKKPRY